MTESCVAAAATLHSPLAAELLAEGERRMAETNAQSVRYNETSFWQ